MQTIILSYSGGRTDYFEKLQYVVFPKLKNFKILSMYCPDPMHIMKFLEVNGKNLEEIYINQNNNALNKSIIKYCPNLKKLYVIFNHDEINILRDILNNCHYLEIIKVYCRDSWCLNENEVLEVIAMNSPKSFHELKIINTKLLPKDLEAFFISWKDRIPLV